jgi:hypothetical protein
LEDSSGSYIYGETRQLAFQNCRIGVVCRCLGQPE